MPKGRRLLRREQAGVGAGAPGALALGGLLGFQDKTVALVAVDPPGRAGTVGMLEVDAAFEDVVVLRVVLLRGARRLDVEQVAQVDHERLRVRLLRAAGLGPGGDEIVRVAARDVARAGIGFGRQGWLSRPSSGWALVGNQQTTTPA